MNLTKPIFILGAHKSGTSLLRNLLSDHSELASIPFESHFFELDNYWVKTEYRKQIPQINNDFKKRAIENAEETNTTKDRKGDAFLDGRLSIELLTKGLEGINEKKDGEKLKQYYNSIFSSLNIEWKGKRVVEKSVENSEFVNELQRFFPDAKFVHVVRNPYSNWVSLRKYKSVDWGYPLIYRMHKNFLESYYWLEKNKRLYPNYLVIKYEDLLLSTEVTMKKIADFCEIIFEEVLLKPTYMGESWEGNSTRNEKFSGVNASFIDKWKEDILPIESHIINNAFSHIVKEYGYDEFSMEGSILKKAKGESLKRYIANRLYKFYI